MPFIWTGLLNKIRTTKQQQKNLHISSLFTLCLCSITIEFLLAIKDGIFLEKFLSGPYSGRCTVWWRTDMWYVKTIRIQGHHDSYAEGLRQKKKWIKVLFKSVFYQVTGQVV